MRADLLRIWQVHTRVDWLALDASGPASPMVPTSNFQEFGRNFNVVVAILYRLHSSLSRVILGPGVAIEFVVLLTSVAYI